MTPGHRGLALSACTLGAAVALLLSAAFAAELGIEPGWRRGLALAGAALAAIVGPLGVSLLRRHFAGLRLVATALGGIAQQPGRMLAAAAPRQLDDGLIELWDTIAALSQRGSPELQLNARLTAILAAVPVPILVISRHGLVTLANQPAADLLGGGRLSAGTSIFDAIDRNDFARHVAGASVDAAVDIELRLIDGSSLGARCRVLRDDGGMVITIDGAATADGLMHALDLHDDVPDRTPPQPLTPLDTLTVMVLDCETTGLNATLDRMLSLGAVRLQGARLLRHEAVDVLVNPGEPIPPASTAIHGITDAMVVEAPTLAQQWPAIEPLLRDCVVVGHNIGFDLTVLQAELQRGGIEWRRPPSLCTVQLAAALDPGQRDLNLEALAEIYGISVTGRHTALGDALLTAEVYLHLLALMQARGDRTLADAQARAATARRVIRQQQAAGW
jgi:DNA polymerase-3 subunit epsilon